VCVFGVIGGGRNISVIGVSGDGVIIGVMV
jgi:hypothetical protein